jgi:hypothetical protein
MRKVRLWYIFFCIANREMIYGLQDNITWSSYATFLYEKGNGYPLLGKRSCPPLERAMSKSYGLSLLMDLVIGLVSGDECCPCYKGCLC